MMQRVKYFTQVRWHSLLSIAFSSPPLHELGWSRSCAFSCRQKFIIWMGIHSLSLKREHFTVWISRFGLCKTNKHLTVISQWKQKSNTPIRCDKRIMKTLKKNIVIEERTMRRQTTQYSFCIFCNPVYFLYGQFEILYGHVDFLYGQIDFLYRSV